MTENAPSTSPPETTEVELKHPGLSAFLAWLWPGAGHLYQGRTAKGVLYMVCILATYFYGLAIGQGHVVYASWRHNDRRLPYICQVGVGLPALPALLQASLVRNGRQPIQIFGETWMAPPHVRDGYRPGQPPDELSRWHEEAGVAFELGTLYTMVAGLLNVLAIYDAFAGPVFPKPEEQSERPPPGRRGRKEEQDKDAGEEEKS